MTDSDALTIARWCWPDEDLGVPWTLECEPSIWSPACLEDVADAESVLIERGLGSSYALALLDQLEIGIHAWCCDHADAIATAPLSARVRALAAVVRAQEAQKA